MSEMVLRLEGVCRSFEQGERRLDILKNVDHRLAEGAIHALVGPSGTGKSTLLHICGLLERPSEGGVAIQGQNCNKLSDGKRTKLRRETIGFVYQSHHLLPDFTASENVAMPQLLAGLSPANAQRRATQLLTRLGWASASNIARPNSRAANSSAWRSPGRWPTTRP